MYRARGTGCGVEDETNRMDNSEKVDLNSQKRVLNRIWRDSQQIQDKPLCPTHTPLSLAHLASLVFFGVPLTLFRAI